MRNFSRYAFMAALLAAALAAVGLILAGHLPVRFSADESIGASGLRSLPDSSPRENLTAGQVAQSGVVKNSEGLLAEKRNVDFSVPQATVDTFPVAQTLPGASGDLAAEIRTGLAETRAMARTPAEKVALTDEFLRLNAEALGELKRRHLPEPKTAPTQTSRGDSPGSPRSGDRRSEIAAALRETWAEARSPAERVALTNQFLKLNAEALAEANAKTPPFPR